jgi:hypothetical protein
MKYTKHTYNGHTYNVERGLVKDIKSADDGRGDFSATYVQVNYDTSDNTIWGDWHCSTGHNEWNQYHSTDIIRVGNFCGHTTLDEICDRAGRARALMDSTGL